MEQRRPHIKVPPPGPEAKRWVERDHAALVRSTKTHPLVVKRASGCFIEDVDGNTFLDFAAGIGVLNTGHGHPHVLDAARKQAEAFVHAAATDFYHVPQTVLAERLAALAPGDAARKVFFANSGTEAVEASLKVARWHSRRPLFLAFMGGFHGRTLGALALTASKRQQRERFLPSTMPGVVHAPYPNPYRNPWGIDGYADPEELSQRALDYIERYVLDAVAPPADVAAAVFEPVQGEGGYIVPPKAFIRGLVRVLREHGILLIADEVQSGVGRTGRMFASEHFDLEPDIMSLAKALASGFPMGASVVRANLDFGVDGAHSTTFGGNAVAAAAANATLDVIEREGLLDNANARGKELREGLDGLKARFDAIGDVRGLGLMLATDFVKDRETREPDAKTRDAVAKEAFRRGLVLLPCGKSGIRYIPPLTVTADEVVMGLEVLEASCSAVLE